VRYCYQITRSRHERQGRASDSNVRRFPAAAFLWFPASGREPQEVDASEDHRSIAESAKLHDQRTTQQRTEESNEAGRIEDEGDGGAARPRRKLKEAKALLDELAA
jgi:hypothetical protein